jgi:hypothetical protein
MMKRLVFTLAAITLICGGFAKHYGIASTFQAVGRQKAIVAVLPVINDNHITNILWDISQELTAEIRKRVYESNKICLQQELASLEVAKLLNVPNPHAISNTAAESLQDAEFAIITEVIEQKEKSFKTHPESASVLTCALSVRVLDLRGAFPKVILQEILDKNYVMAMPYMHCDYKKMAWGTEAFRYTPLGMAHNRLVNELTRRVEAYIEAAQ